MISSRTTRGIIDHVGYPESCPVPHLARVSAMIWTMFVVGSNPHKSVNERDKVEAKEYKPTSIITTTTIEICS
jgi:hypothetical protein